jgi:hypothetical protein
MVTGALNRCRCVGFSDSLDISFLDLLIDNDSAGTLSIVRLAGHDISQAQAFFCDTCHIFLISANRSNWGCLDLGFRIIMREFGHMRWGPLQRVCTCVSRLVRTAGGFMIARGHALTAGLLRRHLWRPGSDALGQMQLRC